MSGSSVPEMNGSPESAVWHGMTDTAGNRLPIESAMLIARSQGGGGGEPILDQIAPGKAGGTALCKRGKQPRRLRAAGILAQTVQGKYPCDHRYL